MINKSMILGLYAIFGGLGNMGILNPSGSKESEERHCKKCGKMFYHHGYMNCKECNSGAHK